MRIRRRTDDEERMLTMPTRTVRVTVDGETTEAEMGSGRVSFEELQYEALWENLGHDDWKQTMEERKAVQQ